MTSFFTEVCVREGHHVLGDLILYDVLALYETVHKKTNNLGFRPGPIQTGLYKHRKELKA